MTPRRRAWWALSACLLAGIADAGTLTEQPLLQGWQFRLAPASSAAATHPAAARWQAANVPGSVQTDLLAAGAIGDPFYRDNEAGLQWIGLATGTTSCLSRSMRPA